MAHLPGTTGHGQPAPQRSRRWARDWAALMLILLGIGGLIGVAFLWHVLAGFAALFAFLVGFGIYLGFD